MKFNLKNSYLTLLILMLASTSSYAGWDPNAEQKAQDTVAEFKKSSPNMTAYFDKARGYIVYPSIAKGAIGIGAAHGTGVVYEKNKVIGGSSLTQVTVGFQLGGQVYSEIVFFEDEAAMAKFKKGEIEISAQVSAIAVSASISAKTDFKDGIAIFTLGKGGLMYEASVGGQKLSFKPK